jgi:hypothetical protein
LKVSPHPTISARGKTPAWLRISALLLGVWLLLWLPIEDQNEILVLLSAAAVNAWLALRYLARRSIPFGKGLLMPTLLGLLAGLLVTPTALFLMAFKTGIHGHGSPDFTGEQILAVIYGTPIWGVAGLLVGLGGGLLRFNFHE